MKKLGKEEKDKNIKLDIPIMKKVIIDIDNIPEINKDNNLIRKKVLEYMKKEKFFKYSNKKNPKKENKVSNEKEFGWFNNIFGKHQL